MIAAAVLAAGESSRMGSPKPLLEIDGETFIARVLSTLRSARIGTIKVVLGHDAGRIMREARLSSDEVVFNPDYRRGQLSSLIAAIEALQGAAVDGLLVCLVDHPLISQRTVDSLIESFYSSGKLIIIPTYRGRRGHPVLFSSELFPELRFAPLSEGARYVVRKNRDHVLELEVDDQGILVDIDTPEDYRRIRGNS